MSALTSLLTQVRDHLNERYQRELGVALAAAGYDQPSWRLVSDADLRSPATAANAAGALVDPELGLVMFVLPFRPEQKLEPAVKAALSLQAELQPAPGTGSPAAQLELRRPASATREAAPWQTALVWLVEGSARANWEAQIGQLRHSSTFSEELALDAIFYEPNQMPAALAGHGWPRLLLVLRQVLRKTTPEEMAAWMSADRAVVQALENFADEFSDPEQARRARLIQEQLGNSALEAKTPATPAGSPRKLDRLEVQDFRNLRHVRLDFGPDPVSCRMIEGPNGTGKSSLFEAIALAFSGASARYSEFLSKAEKDLANRDRRREYVENYLAPMFDSGAQPRVGLNGQPPELLTLASTFEDAAQSEQDWSGNLLGQEISREFALMSADDLAVRVLAGYSPLAERLEQFVEQRVGEANEARQRFLRGLGLSSALTRVESAIEKLGERTLASELPPAPAALLEWLNQLVAHPAAPAEASALLAGWQQWNDPGTRKPLVASLAAGNEESITATLEESLRGFVELTQRTRNLAEQLAQRLTPFGNQVPAALQDLSAWGEWLASRKAPAPATPASTAAAGDLAAAQAKQQTIAKEGLAAKQHLEHLEAVEAFLSRGWQTLHPQQCPTCGAAQARGIEPAVTELRATIRATREQLALEYKTLDAKVKALQKDMAQQGQAPCPLSDGRQDFLRGALNWVTPSGQPPLETQLKDPALRNRLLGLLGRLQKPPPLPREVDARQEAQRTAQVLAARSEDARNIFQEPDRWKPVQKAFVATLTRVVDQHLPNTLQRLWAELTLNLTAAPWLLPQNPVFAVVNKRGAQRVSICVEDRLARYILNQAETHLLGLAWFFTKHLTYGRFRSRFLVMDDPAAHLDETSYREFCRLLRSLVRLHAARQLPFRLLLLLHEGGRARDAARVTGGRVEQLAWLATQKGELLAVESAPRGTTADPAQWFGRAAS